MAETATLKAALRQEQGGTAARKMRREGRIPAIVYGRGEENLVVSLDAHEFEMLVKKYPLDTTVVELTVDGADRRHGRIRALVAEIQSHPYKPQVLHVDFHQIRAGDRVTVQVPVRLTGTAAGVRAGGVLQQPLHDVEVACAVEDIPESIELDVSALEIGESIHASELRVPEGAEILVDADRTVCSVAPPTVIEEVEEAAEVVTEPTRVGEEEAEGDEADES
jgi:large subunit ribosomal protein L25